MGEISIPYNEDAILSFYRKMVKVNDGDPDLFEESYVDFMDLTSPDDAVSDWVFWEETRTPIFIYDFMGWIVQDFDLEKSVHGFIPIYIYIQYDIACVLYNFVFSGGVGAGGFCLICNSCIS